MVRFMEKGTAHGRVATIERAKMKQNERFRLCFVGNCHYGRGGPVQAIGWKSRNHDATRPGGMEHAIAPWGGVRWNNCGGATAG
jgi:hypothetical protein